MAKQDFSKELKKAIKKAGITVQQKAFADLLILGWDEMDAYLASSLYNPSYSLAANVQDMNNLRASDAFTKYYSGRVAMLNKDSDERIEALKSTLSNSGNIDYRSKDVVIDQLGILVDTSQGKEKADYLMRIADLLQMKKEENKDVERVVHFYIPVECPKTCKLFKE